MGMRSYILCFGSYGSSNDCVSFLLRFCPRHPSSVVLRWACLHDTIGVVLRIQPQFKPFKPDNQRSQLSTMESSSRSPPSPDLPPSGQPPVFSLSPSDPQHLHRLNTDDIPEAEKEGSPWYRKPNPNRRLTQPIIAATIPRSEDDVELRGEGLEDPEKNLICGCSKANFIIIVFFMIVLVAAAVGGGVAGSLYASQR